MMFRCDYATTSWYVWNQVERCALMQALCEEAERFSVRRLIVAFGSHLLNIILIIVALAWQSHAFSNRAQLVIVANATVNAGVIASFGYLFLAVVTVASPLAVILWFKRSKRVGSMLSTILQRAANLFTDAGAIAAAVCFCIALHLWRHPSTVPVAGELPLKDYLFYGCNFTIDFFAFAELVKWLCIRLNSWSGSSTP